MKKLGAENKTSDTNNTDTNFPEEDDHDLFDIPEMPPITSVSEFTNT